MTLTLQSMHVQGFVHQSNNYLVSRHVSGPHIHCLNVSVYQLCCIALALQKAPWAFCLFLIVRSQTHCGHSFIHTLNFIMIVFFLG